MNGPRILLGALVAFALVGAPMARASEIEQDEKRLGKVAIPDDDTHTAKAKGLCMCLDPGAQSRSLGLITYGRVVLGPSSEKIQVYCETITYDAAGTRAEATTCDDWLPLIK